MAASKSMDKVLMVSTLQATNPLCGLPVAAKGEERIFLDPAFV